MMENHEQLLPGIPDELTLKEIASKVPWRELYGLACVSRGWRNAIRSRQVYEERLRSGLTETCIVADSQSHIVVCCLSDKSLLKLPRCPHLQSGRVLSNLIAVDGKVYILGRRFCDNSSEMVYMFDLAGQGVWTQCASMHISRADFACGSMDGKIYVFGGITKDGHRTCAVEVFDPKENIWSQMTSMPIPKSHHGVVALGEELVLYWGFTERGRPQQGPGDPRALQIYHPLKDEWRSVPYPFRICYDPAVIFVAQGNLHLMSHSSIEIQDVDGRPCRELHSNSYSTIGRHDSSRFDPVSVLVVNDEIFASGFFNGGPQDVIIPGFRFLPGGFLQSRGLGTEKKEMVWQKERDWFSLAGTTSMHAIQL